MDTYKTTKIEHLEQIYQIIYNAMMKKTITYDQYLRFKHNLKIIIDEIRYMLNQCKEMDA